MSAARRGGLGAATQALAAALLIAVAPAPAAYGTPAPAATTAGSGAAHALLAGLARAGRAEATLRYELPGPPGGPARAIRATLALERPTLARLDVRTTGEAVTLRADGGEWLQPAARQLVRLQPQQAIAALRWWRVLLAGGAREQRLGPDEYRLVVPATPEAAADSADVRLDPRGLPERLTLADGLGGAQVYRLSGWHFARARGAAAFTLAAPAGWDVVDLP